MADYYIGVDVGGTKIAFALFDVEKQMLDKKVIATNKDLEPEIFFDEISNEIHEFLESNAISMENLKGIGIGIPSFLIYEEGYILMTSNLPKIRDFSVRKYLEKKLKVRIVVDNDGNAAALAEHRNGAGKGKKHMLYCPVGTGISSAIIINGSIFHGSYGWAGESGHSLITPNTGIKCGCGNQGCFMSHISGSMIVERIKDKIEAGENTILVDLAGGNVEDIDAKCILKAHREGDRLAEWAVEHMAEYMGIWLFNIYQILNINYFVFGGGLVNFGHILFDRAIEHFNDYNKIDLPVEFVFAELKDDFGVVGAMELLFD